MITRRNFVFGACGLTAAGSLVPRTAWARGGPAAASESFHVGTYDVVPDRSLNFQINRWVSHGGEPLLREIQAMAPRLVSLDAWRNEFLAAAERAMAAGRPHDAAILLRSAEFFMTSTDPRKRPSRERFLTLMRQAYGVGPPDRLPFAGGYLPFYRFVPSAPSATVVLFGGFDSYIEEFFPILTAMRNRGFDVVAFEGPGQGGALEDSSIPMTPDWHRPVGAILDRLSLSGVTLLGISLGGCLAIRAAAYEPRVTRVVAFDALTDLLECILRQLPPASQRLVRALLAARADRLIDVLQAPAAREPIRAWGIAQGMHVLGVHSPSAVLRAAAAYRTQEASPLVQQDVLLLAGAEDHYVPTHQIYDQAAWLSKARSVTTRMFSRAEQAQSHCQVGNLPLAIRTIAAWMDQVTGTGNAAASDQTPRRHRRRHRPPA
jgi:alpha-beta hydrolase superfamily lysophospholipase